MLGHNLIGTSTSGDSSPTTTSTSGGGGGIGGFLTSLVASATSAVGGAVESGIASIEGDIADKLADELGIKEFYALHAMDMCEGDFRPNATAPGATYNATSTNCTAAMDFSYMNVSALLDRELSLGPLHVSLSDLGFTTDLQSKLDDLPRLFEVLAVMYILGAAFSGLAILTSVAGFFLVPKSGRKIVILNFVVALLAMLFLLVGSLFTTIGGKKAVDEIEKYGSDAGLVVTQGTKFQGLSWAAFALMTVATFYWAYEFFAETKARKRNGVSGKRRVKDERYSMESYHR